jgi:predicted dehydrogenase
MRYPRPSRRRLLRTAVAAAVAGPTIIRVAALGAADGTAAPSNRITMGFIGVGKQGMGHLSAIAKRKDVTVLAVSDVQEVKREKARETIEKSAGSGGGGGGGGGAPGAGEPKKPVSNEPTAGPDASSPWDSVGGGGGGRSGTSAGDVKYYNDFRELLARRDIDAVLIATPDHWHGTQVVEAARAGKDIYCEKPLTLTVGEAREAIAAVRHRGRVLQVGSQQRSSREFRFACEMIRNGRIGKLRTIHTTVGGPSKECDLPPQPVREGVDWDMWLGPAAWRPFHAELCPGPEFDGFPHWRNYRDFSGGGMTDWGAHHFDISQWAMGMDDSGPVEVIPPDGRSRNWLTYRYASGVELYQGKGGGGKGIVFSGDAGEIEVGRGFLATRPAGIMRAPTGPNEIRLYNSPGHHEDFFRAVRERRDPICPVEIGARTVTVCHIGNIAYWLRRPLRWDPAKWEFVGDVEANRWLDRPKRGNWMV